MSTDTIPAPGTPTSASPAPGTSARPVRHVMAVALMTLMSAFSMVAASTALPAAANPASMVIDQCNGHAPAAQGATTAMRCTVTVVNTITGTKTRSTTTVTRLCTLGPCSTPNGTFTTTSLSLVTAIRQCNNSDNDAAHAISCSVTITNNIGRDTPGAQPMTAPRATQCVGSARGGGGTADCRPAPESGAMVTQCNGSGNGGGGTVRCTVDPRSRVSRAIPVKITQCNGTGNVGGSTVTCRASIITNLTRATTPAASPVATPVPTTATTSAPATTSPTSAAPTSPPASSAPAAVGIEATPTTGLQPEGLVMIGAGLVLAAAIGALLFRRFGGIDLLRRFTRSS